MDRSSRTSAKFAAQTRLRPVRVRHLSGDLYKSGNRIRLQGKPLQILSLLVDRHGEVVSREELRQHLWQDTTFVDFEQGMNAAVNKLRQALGDAAVQPRYVETIPGRGYRFVALVHQPTARAVLEIASPAPLRTDAPRRNQLKRWLPVLPQWPRSFSCSEHTGSVRESNEGRVLHLTRFAVSPPPGSRSKARPAASRFRYLRMVVRLPSRPWIPVAPPASLCAN
ncbi:MAG: winged helix-turn-helix domain-containing protein [Bryobacterales bacterium]|nr:winged helix-turn-helix domain-containing protein [Bryobacterales bacterium]